MSPILVAGVSVKPARLITPPRSALAWTGTLWLAVGYHVSFDYMQLFVIGTKNGSVEPVNHLLNASFQGPAWVTGGVLGTEASFLVYPSIALLFLYTWWRSRQSQ